MACQKVCKQGRDEAKVNVLAMSIPTSFSHYSLTVSLRAAAESSPTMQLLMLVFEFYTLITMTSLEFTQSQGLGYTRGMYRVPLSIPTYDSVIKVHGMVLASSPGHFPPPTWPRSA